MATTNQRDQIFTGDTYAVRFECMQSDPIALNSMNQPKSPITPTGGYAQLLNTITQELVPIGGVDTFTDELTIDDHVITYIVQPEYTQETGDFKLFITATFGVDDEEQSVTEMRRFRVESRET